MLELLQLDDAEFSDILAQSMEMLPRLCPEWTDYNTHDPGITFLDTLTWLTEMQRYYISQITGEHRLKYLKLLGEAPREASPANLLAVLHMSGDEPVTVKKGTAADVGGIPYTLERDIWLSNIRIDITTMPDCPGSEIFGFHPFGNPPQTEGEFYLNLSETIESGHDISLYVHLLQSGRHEYTPLKEGYSQPAQLFFHFWDSQSWHILEIRDETFGFVQSGFISFTLPMTMWPYHGKNLIKISFIRQRDTASPAFDWMSLQTVTLIQRDNTGVTLGMTGRVKENLSFPIFADGIRIEARNPFPSYGGYNAETVEDAFIRCNNERGHPFRAVCYQDFISIVTDTPGLRIDTVHVFTKSSGIICVCVKPEGETLTASDIQNIRRRLLPVKLACMELEITPPVYFKALLRGEIELEKWAVGQNDKLISTLNNILSPLESRFGLTISLSELTAEIIGLSMVHEVRDLSLRGLNGMVLTSQNDYTLPQNSLLKIINIDISVT